MRVPGTVIWATELAESRETSGGGKGKPKVTSYSYSSSFAVALASRPIEGVGRVWADGNLLRGAAGDLKAGGAMRVHTGHGDQQPDPLIAAAEGAGCPAFRNRAYVVFEDLELADFGNRVPALTFEVFADSGPLSLGDLVIPLVPSAAASVSLAALAGYSYEGGSLRASLETVAQLLPMACDAGGGGLAIAEPETATELVLPEAVVSRDEDGFGAVDGRRRVRSPGAADAAAVRYYDVARDYQPGLQRSAARAGDVQEAAIDFPAALSADAARGLIDAAARRTRWRGETQAYRIAELDPALVPGRSVRVPGSAGSWRVEGWEWREHGIELELARIAAGGATAPAGAPGTPGLPRDTLPWPTELRAFELPWDGIGDAATPARFAAASAFGESWRGAALYAERAGVLVPLGPTGRARSMTGTIVEPLRPSRSLRLEGSASLRVDLAAGDLELSATTVEGIASGANRMLIGGEVLQFLRATRESETGWRLEGLLRGRGGTEAAAFAGHPAATAATLLDGTLLALPPGEADEAIAAIGDAEEAPVTAAIENPGMTLRPLLPVHARAALLPSGDLALSWVRRARGAWIWRDAIDVPLVEEGELYRVGVGAIDAPAASWEAPEPRLTIAAAELAQLTAGHPGATVWVRQIGSFAASDALALYVLP